jgi:hypothetical protein
MNTLADTVKTRIKGHYFYVRLNFDSYIIGTSLVRDKAELVLKQWRSQPDDLVPQCKFQLIIIIHFFRN